MALTENARLFYRAVPDLRHLLIVRERIHASRPIVCIGTLSHREKIAGNMRRN